MQGEEKTERPTQAKAMVAIVVVVVFANADAVNVPSSIFEGAVRT